MDFPDTSTTVCLGGGNGGAGVGGAGSVCVCVCGGGGVPADTADMCRFPVLAPSANSSTDALHYSAADGKQICLGGWKVCIWF